MNYGKWARIFGITAILFFALGLIIGSLPTIYYHPFIARTRIVWKLERSNVEYVELGDIGLFYSIEISQVWDGSLPPDRTYYIRFKACPEDLLVLRDTGSDGEVDEILISFGGLSQEPRTALEGFLQLDLRGEESSGIVLERPSGEGFSYLQTVFNRADNLISYLKTRI